MSLLPGDQGHSQNLDPIDVEFHQDGALAARLVSPPSSAALDWQAGPFPALLLLSGVALGPQGLAVLTPHALALLDPAAPVAIALLGVLAGLSVRGGGTDRRIDAAAEAQAMITAILVGTLMLTAVPAVGALGRPLLRWWIAALVIGLSAATSASLPTDPSGAADDLAVGLERRDYRCAIVLGGVLLAFVRTLSLVAALSLAAQAAAIAVIIAIAAWLLVSRASTPAEQRVFAFATILLLGGASDYLSVSALLSGLVAGATWHRIGGRVRESIRRDVTYAQHSLLVLILLIAGARAEFSRAALMVALAYVVVRTSGKLASGWLAARALAGVPRDSGLRLIAPGVFGVAFALNAVRADGPAWTPVLAAVVAGTIGSSLIAAAFSRSETSDG